MVLKRMTQTHLPPLQPVTPTSFANLNLTQALTFQFSIQNQSNNNFVPTRLADSNQNKNTMDYTREIQKKKKGSDEEGDKLFQDLINQEFEYQEEKGLPPLIKNGKKLFLPNGY